MKKKGLIISTIVMVVVLIASLTTATYAWFNAAAVTKIDAFEVSVATNNAVKIGVKENNTYSENPNANMFKTGTVTYSPGTAGVLGGGTWGGAVTGLSATINHDIKWGEQSKSIGFSNSQVSVSTSDDNTILKNIASSINTATTVDPAHTQGQGYIYAAEGVNASTSDANGSLSNITAAKANKDGQNNGDYVYLFLGAAPTRTLLTNELIILLDANSGSGVTLGLLASVHVAYRLNSNAAWTDAAIFSGNDNQSTPAAITANTLKENITCDLSEAEAATFNNTYGAGLAPTVAARALRITELSTTKDQIDQIEILIYIDGTDATNNNQDAISGVGGSISIFFHTTEQQAQNP